MDLIHLYIDVHILDALAVSNRQLDIENMLDKGWDRKLKKYQSACDEFGVEFSPFVCTQGGLISKKSMIFLNNILKIKRIDKAAADGSVSLLTYEEKRRLKIRNDFMTSLSFICNKWAALSLLEHLQN